MLGGLTYRAAVSDAGALRANRFVLGFELPRLLNRFGQASAIKRALRSGVCAHVTGHGLCVRLSLLDRLPLATPMAVQACLDDVSAMLAAHGAEITAGPAEGPIGLFMYARHADGAEVEYLQLKPGLKARIFGREQHVGMAHQSGGSDEVETLSPVVERLLAAINEHDAHAVAACFSADCEQDTPLHPSRDFVGSEQVYRNWSRLLADLPDLRAGILRWAVHGDEVWTEWDMSGTRQDGSRQVFRGVAVHEVSSGLIRSTRFYLETVDP